MLPDQGGDASFLELPPDGAGVFVEGAGDPAAADALVVDDSDGDEGAPASWLGPASADALGAALGSARGKTGRGGVSRGF